jgi:FkbM family methyltransferase
MTFIDVGAHVGLLTLTGARAVGPRGRVLALEPTPAAFDLLTRAVAVNGLGELVVAKRLACGARRDRRAFYIGRVLGHSSLCALAPESMETEIEVDVEPLDELVRPGDRVDVVKLDVEGAELDVLAGMTRIIRENANLAIVAEFGHSHLLRTGISPEAWFGAFRAHGLEAYAIDELSGHCRPSGPWDLANVESINVLFCGPNSRVAAHVKS